MGRYLTESGEETNDLAEAAQQDGSRCRTRHATSGSPRRRPTALYMGFFGEAVSMFGILVAIALIIAGRSDSILAYATVLAAEPRC